MKTALNLLVLALLAFFAVPSPCFALRLIAPVTKAEAKKMGIEVRTKPAGPDAVALELEFKPEGKLKQFTHVELTRTEGEKPLTISEGVKETRSSSGNVIVSFTVSRAQLEKTTLSVVMREPNED